MGATPAIEAPPTTRMPGYLITWRIVIAGLAWWGPLAALRGDITQLRYFSQVTTLTVALTATASVLGFAVVSERWNWAMAWCSVRIAGERSSRLTAGPLGRRGPRLPVTGEPPRSGWIGNRAKRAQNPILSYAGYIRVRIE